MSPESESHDLNSFLFQFSCYGIILGLLIVFFQVQATGILSPSRGFVLNDTILALLIIGFLLTLFSFLCLRWSQYRRFCLVDPEVTKELLGTASLSIKILVLTIIGFNALVILVLFLSLPAALKNQDRTIPLLVLLLCCGIDMVLWFMYKTVKASDKGESVSPMNYTKILFSASGFAGIVVLLAIEWYYNQIPDSEKSVFMIIPPFVILVLMIYISQVRRKKGI